MEDPSNLLNRVIQTDPIGSMPMLMPGAGRAKPGDIMMLDGRKQWGPADAFGDHLLQPFGYQRIPAGFMMQWGTTGTIEGYGYSNTGGYSNYGANNSLNVSFYKDFQYICFGVYGNGTGSFTYDSNYGGSGMGGYSYNTTFPSAGITFNNITRYGFTVYNNTPIDMACRWFAVGH